MRCFQKNKKRCDLFTFHFDRFDMYNAAASRGRKCTNVRKMDPCANTNLIFKKVSMHPPLRKRLRFYLSIIPTFNSFLKNSHFSKKNSHVYLIRSGNLSGK